MMSRANEFLGLYSEIEQILRKRSNESDYVELSRILANLSRKDPVVRNIENRLRPYMPLRNAIAHTYNKNQQIADPREGVLVDMKNIRDTLNKPPTVRGIMSGEVFSCTIDDSLSEVLKHMSTDGYTSVPVYSGDFLVGILTEKSVVDWQAAVIDAADVTMYEAKKVGDIQEYLTPSHGGSFDLFEFAHRDTDIFTVKELFERAISSGRRLNAVFVTHSGKEGEKILGIVTAWDLQKVKE